MIDLSAMGMRAREAARILALTDGEARSCALRAIAEALETQSRSIIAENSLDIADGKAAGLSSALLDRLKLDEERIRSMADGARSVASFPDPLGRILSRADMPSGLNITKVTVPLGVIGVIYEARPNVTADSAVLCLKSGNAVILRGGKEAIRSNTRIAAIMRDAVSSVGLPADSIQLITDTSRESAEALMRMNGFVDVLIPRGGAGLIQSVVKNATVPIIETGAGVCHTYIDSAADLCMAASIVFNAKTSRPSVCNACECILVHEDVANEFLPMAKALLDTENVELRGDAATLSIIKDAVPASDDDWGREYNDYILACRVVGSMDEAIEHIFRYGTKHSECIVTRDMQNAERFLSAVDAAAVYVNASTRFTDGAEFGLGAEIGISTQKLHARGPLGLNELTSTKYLVRGAGQIR